MKTRHLLIALSISTFTIANIPQNPILAQPNQPEETEPLTTAIAQQAAAKITVRIQVGQSGGSGVIIGKKGNTYLVLTNAHVVREPAEPNIQTPDGQKYRATRVKNTQVGNFDLALLEFTSSRSYQLAKFKDFGNSGEAALNEGREVFAAGFPYDSNALRVAIYDRIIAKGGKAWAYYNRGNTKSALGDKKGALANYDTAIRINPQYGKAYYNRGTEKYEVGDKRGAIADYQIAAKIFRSQNNMTSYDRAMNQVRQLSQQ
jgi:S1-C subfamily serine protease